MVQKHFNTVRFYNTHRISGNSLTSIATSIWMDGVSSSKMMSAMWQRTLSNQDELDSWSRDTSLSNIKQLLWILQSNWIVSGLSVWLNWFQTLILPPPRGLRLHISCFFNKFIMHESWKHNEENEEKSWLQKWWLVRIKLSLSCVWMNWDAKVWDLGGTKFLSLLLSHLDV